MKQLLHLLFIVITTFILLETVIRLCGVTPFQVQPFQIQSTPDFCLMPNATYGFGLNPGEFDVTMNDAIEYTCTHNADSMRIVSYSPSTTFDKTIDIHGCSFTYGMSVDDSLTFPFLLQKEFSNQRFRNFAVPGFGNIQALIHLQNQIRTGDLPNIIVICYTDFHDERNALNTSYRKSLYHGFLNANTQVKPLFHTSKIPFYALNQGVQYQDWNNIYHNWTGRNYLASVNSIQDAIEKMTENDGKTTTHQILLAIHKLCQQHEIQLIFAPLTNNDNTTFTQQFCEQNGLTVFDIGLDLMNPMYNNLPHDIHPNKVAHQIFSERLTKAFRNFKKMN